VPDGDRRAAAETPLGVAHSVGAVLPCVHLLATKMRAVLLAVSGALLDSALAAQVGRSLQDHSLRIVPKLENVASDKKFFGPPFPADYPDDLSPRVSGDLQPKKHGAIYPKLHDSDFYDKDYVKDENADGGEWAAQMAYDTARNKYDKENQLSEAAQERMKRERREAEDAEKKLKEAVAAEAAAEKAAAEAKKQEKDAEAAENGVEKAAQAAEEKSKKGSEHAKILKMSKDEVDKKVEEVGKKLDEARENLKKEEAEFKECQKKFEEAKAELEKLRHEHEALKKRQEEILGQKVGDASEEDYKDELEVAHAKASAAEAKVNAAKAKLDVADADQKKEQTEYEQQKHQKDDASAAEATQAKETEEAKEDLEAAKKKLRSIRNPGILGNPLPQQPKSGSVVPGLSALVMVLSLCVAALQ